MSQKVMSYGFLAAYGIAFQAMAFMINKYGHENQPKGYKFPDYKGIWMTVVGLFFWKFLKSVVGMFFLPIVRK